MIHYFDVSPMAQDIVNVYKSRVRTGHKFLRQGNTDTDRLRRRTVRHRAESVVERRPSAALRQQDVFVVSLFTADMTGKPMDVRTKTEKALLYDQGMR